MKYHIGQKIVLNFRQSEIEKYPGIEPDNHKKAIITNVCDYKDIYDYEVQFKKDATQTPDYYVYEDEMKPSTINYQKIKELSK